METDKIKKEKFSKEYMQWVRLILRSKLKLRNKIMVVNNWAVSVTRYGAEILTWITVY